MTQEEKKMQNAVISSGLRTPAGRFGGSLKEVSAVELGTVVVKALLEKTGLKPELVDEVIMGNALQAGCGQNPARQVSICSDIPYKCPGFTVNKVCGSGIKAAALAASAVQSGQAQFVIAGGMENMSMAPYLLRRARFGYRLGHGQIEDSLIHDGLWDAFGDVHMGVLSEALADKFGINREAQDRFAVESQSKYQSAFRGGRFEAEIAPVPLADGIFDTDEHPRETTLEALAGLRPAFKEGGTVTAGNSSGINDAACALLIAGEENALDNSLPVMARILDCVSIGVEPEMMGLGPVTAIKKVLDRNGLTLDEVDLYEINEAFASQTLAVVKELGLDESKLNVNGGAIALGHPIGASGARIIVTLVHELIRRSKRLGVAALCIGGGMGMAMLIERSE